MGSTRTPKIRVVQSVGRMGQWGPGDPNIKVCRDAPVPLCIIIFFFRADCNFFLYSATTFYFLF